MTVAAKAIVPGLITKESKEHETSQPSSSSELSEPPSRPLQPMGSTCFKFANLKALVLCLLAFLFSAAASGLSPLLSSSSSSSSALDLTLFSPAAAATDANADAGRQLAASSTVAVHSSSSSSSSASSSLSSVSTAGATSAASAAAAAAQCDYSRGSWVVDNRLPIYTGLTCNQVRSSQNCARWQRTDKAYQKLRWVPHNCVAKKVTPSNLAWAFRNKLVVLAGDSPSKNFASSIACILAAGRSKFVSYSLKVGGQTFTGVRVAGLNVRFISIFSNYLTKYQRTNVSLDAVDPSLAALVSVADVVLMQATNWWTSYQHNFFSRNKIVKLSNLEAYEVGMTFVAKYMATHLKGKAYLLSANPSHYGLPGNIGTPGGCLVTKPLTVSQVAGILQGNPMAVQLLRIQKRVASRTSLKLVDVTTMSIYRPDGHLQIWTKLGGNRTPGARQDCLHWCESGVTDAWVEALYNSL